MFFGVGTLHPKVSLMEMGDRVAYGVGSENKMCAVLVQADDL